MTANTAPQHYRDTCTRCIELEKKISELNAMAKMKKANKAKQPRFYSLTFKENEDLYSRIIYLWLGCIPLAASCAMFDYDSLLLGTLLGVLGLGIQLFPGKYILVKVPVEPVPVEPLSFDDQTDTTTS